MGAEWAGEARGETGDGSFGEKTERVDTGILVLSHHPYGSSHHAQAHHSPASGSNLKGNKSTDPKRDSAMPCRA